MTQVIPITRPNPLIDRLGTPSGNFRHLLADGGYYFTATGGSANWGTGTAYVIQQTFDATKALITIRNAATQGTQGGQNAAANANTTSKPMPNVVPDFIKLVCVTAPASATSGQYGIITDTPAAARDSAGTVLTGNPPDTQRSVDGVTPAAVVRMTPTVAAATSPISVDRGVMRSVILVANDEIIFKFGDGIDGSISDIAGTTAKRIVIPCPPVVLAPGGFHTMLLHVWFPANAATAPVFEPTVGWAEK